jgi:lipoprotein-anchoring transpeptidase ErfK/SrfK
VLFLVLIYRFSHLVRSAVFMSQSNVQGGLLLKCLIGLLVYFATSFPSEVVWAQAAGNITVGEDRHRTLPQKARSSVEQAHTGEVHKETVAALAPPLPFSSPQVGPVIKRTYADDVDRRTTAFVPQEATLNRLTPVEFPKDEEKWIRVDLSEQMVVAYENNRPLRAFIISSGLPRTPTVTGQFRIRTKVREQVMYGDNYYLPGVQWVQYFYKDYSFHGTYWHNNFGNPMSHGCVNMTNADAKWLFDWAGPVWDHKTTWFKSTAENPGTLVIVTE